MIRNAVLYGTIPTATSLKTAEEIALERRAIKAIAEYKLVKDGVTGYAQLGFALPNGRVIAPKLREHLVIDAAYSNAFAEKYKNK